MRVDDRYAQSMQRTMKISTAGAVMITLLTLAAVAPNVRHVLIVLAVQVVLTAVNTWVTMWLLPRRGPAFSETLRAIANLSGSLVIGLLTGWPLPLWLWLPYIGVVFDHFRPGLPTRVLLAFGGTVGVVGVLSGVPWMVPTAFLAIALLVSEMSRARFESIRAMLLESDEHRLQLETAHAEVRRANEQLQLEIGTRQQAELELRQKHKLEAVGRLAAGVAHEINTPVQFVGDCVTFVRGAVGDLGGVVERYRALRQAVERGEPATALAADAARAEEEADADYAIEHVPRAIERSIEGLDRVASIVRSLKQFAHPDQKEMMPFQLNQGIESTLTIARNEYKYVADVQVDLGELPPVLCHPGDVNQVILNLLVNAAHAVAEVVGASGRRGQIRVQTRVEKGAAVIRISDSGAGIPPDLRERIFEPFFTTKEVGRGTGQGLAIARTTVERHGGQIDFESEAGKGTTFTVRLPLRRGDGLAEAAA